MEREENKKKNNRLFYLILLLLITTVTLATSSYAWFTTNRLVKVDLLNVNVRAQGGIEISVDGTNWKGSVSVDDISTARSTYGGSVNQIPYTLEPVSSAIELENGKLKMFYGTATNNASGDYIISTTRSVETESFGEESEGKFIVFDIFLKTSSDSNLYLTPESNATYGGDSSAGIENAVRFAFVEEGNTAAGTALGVIQGLSTNDNSKVYVWEPNYDTHTNHGIENARDVYGINISSPSPYVSYDGVSDAFESSVGITTNRANKNNYPAYFKTVDVDYYTENGFTSNKEIFNLKSGITKYRVYMWIEGQDVDCENNASIGNISLNLQFSTNPS